MDISKVKFCGSLRWLSGLVAEGDDHGQRSALPVRELLLDPYTNADSLKSEVVALLSDPSLCTSAYTKLFPEEELDGSTFWPLIQALARRGVYVVEDEDVAVNHTVLAQTSPFRQASHIALIEGLMSLFASTTLNVERVVKAVRRISTFNPSKELPCGVEDALLLWLNKTAQAVCSKRSQKEEEEGTDARLHDPDARQRRRRKRTTKLEEGPGIPVMEDLSSGIADGQHLAALLLYYAPHAAKWEDFVFGRSPLSKEQSLQNLQRVAQYCRTHLPPPGFHLQPEDELLQWAHTGILKPNIQALLAHLFRCFEVCGLGNKKSLELPQKKKPQDTLVRSVLTKQTSLANKKSLHSYSTSELLNAAQTSDGKSKHLNSTSHLSSHSTSELTPHRHATMPPTASSSTVFQPPVRSSVTASQAAALAGFNKHFRPSAAAASSHSLITASTEALGIREQMLGERLSRSNVSQRRAPARYSLDSSDSSESSGEGGGMVELSSGSGAADVSGNCTESWNPPTSQAGRSDQQPQGTANTGIATAAAIRQGGPEVPVKISSEQPKTSKSTRFCIDMSTKGGLELKSSFTLNKHHTAATASEAGLPVIKDSDDVFHSVSAPEEHKQRRKLRVSSSGSSSGCMPSVKLLQLYQAAPEQRLFEVRPPPAIVEAQRQLTAKWLELKSQMAVKDGKELIKRQKFFHQVYIARMKQEKASNGGANTQTVDPPVQSLQVPAPQPSTAPPPTMEKTHSKVAVQSEPKPQRQEENVAAEAWQTKCSTSKKLLPNTVPSIPLSPIQPPTSQETDPANQATAAAAAAAPRSETNPWRKELLPESDGGALLATGSTADEGLLNWREQQMRARLEERERARRANMESRRKAQQECKKQAYQYSEATAAAGSEEKGGTIHFQLSAKPEPPQHDNSTTDLAPLAPPSQPKLLLEDIQYLHHNGPECYVRPPTKSNLKIIRNALCYVCLAGDVNVTVKQRALAELEASTANHVLVLFRDTIGFKFRALYSYTPDDYHVTKIFGNGPRVIKQHMISHLYKYNSGLKEFKEVHTRFFSLSVDALTITNHYWTTARKSSKPPSGPHR